MLYLMALGALVGSGAAYEAAYESTMYQSMTAYEDEPVYAQQYSEAPDSAEMYQHDGGYHDGDHHGDYDHGYHDWLSPGGAYYWGYPSYYYSSWYSPAYTYYPTYYTYPTTYYYTYPTYYTYSAPIVYDWVADPWWAANAYGIGSTTYYYSSSSSWSYHGGYGGFFFGP